MNGAHAVVFGKLPRHGDFVSRGLDARHREAWDVWLSAAMERARGELGEDFAAAHDAAPPWRFISGPGPFGVRWRAGALAASVDTAGRRFAIVSAAEDLDEAGAATLGEPFAEAMEAVIYRAFEDGWDADRLAGAIETEITAREPAPSPDDRMAEPRERWWTVGSETRAPISLDRAPTRLFEAAR